MAKKQERPWDEGKVKRGKGGKFAKKAERSTGIPATAEQMIDERVKGKLSPKAQEFLGKVHGAAQARIDTANRVHRSLGGPVAERHDAVVAKEKAETSLFRLLGEMGKDRDGGDRHTTFEKAHSQSSRGGLASGNKDRSLYLKEVVKAMSDIRQDLIAMNDDIDPMMTEEEVRDAAVEKLPDTYACKPFLKGVDPDPNNTPLAKVEEIAKKTLPDDQQKSLDEGLPEPFDKKAWANVSTITSRGIDFPSEESPVDPQKVGEALDEYYLNEASPFIAKRAYPEEEREAIKARTVAMLSSAKSMDDLVAMATEIDEKTRKFHESTQALKDATDKTIKALHDLSEWIDVIDVDEVTRAQPIRESTPVIDHFQINGRIRTSDAEEKMVAKARENLADVIELTGVPVPEGFTVNLNVPSDTSHWSEHRREMQIAEYAISGPSGGRRTIFHEYGHATETYVPGLAAKEKEWLKNRSYDGTTHDGILPDYKGNPVNGYLDAYISTYTGRVYPDNHTELMSTGLEYFADEYGMAKLYSVDPGHFTFVLEQILEAKRARKHSKYRKQPAQRKDADTGASTEEGQPTRKEQLNEDPIGFKKGKLNIVWRPPAEQKQDAEDEFEENEHKRDRFGRFTRGSFSPAPMAQPDLSKQRLVSAFRAQGRKLDPSLSTGELHRAAKTKAELFHQPGKPDHIRKHSLPSHNLSRGLLQALNRYTEEAWGKDVSYYTMNKALKAGELPSDDPDSELSTEIDSVQAALLALPPYQHSGPDAALYRSMARYGKRSGKELVSEEFLQAYEDAVGDVIQDPAFVSTSNDVSGATAFGRGKGGVMFVVKPDPNAQGESVGRDIKPYSQAPGENEILFPHGAYFKVAGVYRGEGRTPLPPVGEPDDDYMDLLDDDDEDFLDLSDDEDPIFVSSDPMAHIIDYRDKALDAMGAGHLKEMVHNGMVRRSRIDATIDLRIYGDSPRLFKDLDEHERVGLLVQGMYGVKTQEDALARLKNMTPGDETEEYILEVDARKKGILALGKKGYICAAEIVMELENRKAQGNPYFDDDPDAHGSSKQYARDKVADMYTKSAMSYLESSLTTVDDDNAVVSDPDKFLARSEKILDHFDQNPKFLRDMSVTELYNYIDKSGSDLMAYLPGLGDYMTPKALTTLSDGHMTPEIEDAVKFIDNKKQVVRALGTDAARLIARTYAAVWKNPDLGQYPDPLNAKIPPKAKRVLPPELQYLDSHPEIDKSVSIIVLEEVNAKFTSSFKRERKDAEGLPLALGPQIMADFILGADPLTDIQGWTELEVLQEGGALASFLLSEYLPGAEGRWDTIVAPDVLRRVILSADPMVNISPWDETEVAGEAQAILSFLVEEYRRSSVEDLTKSPAEYVPQDIARYTESSTEPEATCKDCVAYLDTRRCRIVRGHISPYGKCALWESATPLFVNRNDDNKPVQRIVDWQGLKLGLQYLPGDIRHGKRITAAYGNVRGTYGQADDGMAFDVWVNLKGGNRCFKLQQLTDEGEHDEFKYILGASSLEDAKAIYAANMPSRLMGEVVECEVDELAPVVKRKDADEPWDEKKVVRGKGGRFAKKPAAVERPIGTPEQQNPNLSQGPRSLFVQDCANGCSYGKSSDAEVRLFINTSILRSQQAQKYIALHRQSRTKWIDDAINELQAEAQRLTDEYKASLHPIYSQTKDWSLGNGEQVDSMLKGARNMHEVIAEDDPAIGDFDEDSFLERTVRREVEKDARMSGRDSTEETIQSKLARDKADLSTYREVVKAIESGEIEEKSVYDVGYRIRNLEEEAVEKVPRLQSVFEELDSLNERLYLEGNGDPENPRDAMQFFGDSEKMMSYIKGHSTQNIRTTEDSEGEIIQVGAVSRLGPILDVDLLASDALSCPSKIKDEAIAAAKFCAEMPGATNELRAEALEFIEEMESSKRYQGFASGVFLEGAIGEAYLRGIDTITCNPIDRNIRLFERAGFKDDGDHHVLAPDDAWKFWEARKTMGQRKDAISKSDADAWMADLAKLEAELGPMMCGGSIATRTDAGEPDHPVELELQLEAYLMKEVEPILEARIEKLRKAAEASEGYQDLNERLPDLYDQLPKQELVDAVYRAFMYSNLIGRMQVQQEVNRELGLAPEREDAPTPEFLRQGFQEAMDYLRQKVNIVTSTWKALTAEQHDMAYTVAGLMDARILQDVRWLIEHSEANGIGFDEFKPMFHRLITRKGWRPGEHPDADKEDHRLKVLFETPIRRAISAGRNKQVAEALADPTVKSLMPGRMWLHTSTPERYTREYPNARMHHLALHRKVFPADHEFWKIAAPSCDYLCRCHSVLVSKRKMEAEGLTLEEPPDPRRIAGPGFQRSAGMADEGEARQAALSAMESLPSDLEAVVYKDFHRKGIL